MARQGITIKDLARETGISYDTLHNVLIHTPRWQRFGQSVFDREAGIREARVNIETLADKYSGMYAKYGKEVYRERAVRFRGYAEKLKALEV